MLIFAYIIKLFIILSPASTINPNTNMKKIFNMTVAVEVESEIEIDNINSIDFNVSVNSKEAKVKVIDIPECYEVLA